MHINEVLKVTEFEQTFNLYTGIKNFDKLPNAYALNSLGNIV